MKSYDKIHSTSGLITHTLLIGIKLVLGIINLVAACCYQLVVSSINFISVVVNMGVSKSGNRVNYDHPLVKEDPKLRWRMNC